MHFRILKMTATLVAFRQLWHAPDSFSAGSGGTYSAPPDALAGLRGGGEEGMGEERAGGQGGQGRGGDGTPPLTQISGSAPGVCVSVRLCVCLLICAKERF